MASGFDQVFSQAAMQATIASSRGEGMDSGLPDAQRFLSGAVKIILARKENKQLANSDSTKPAIFFLGPPPPEASDSTTKRRLLSQGQIDFTGKQWFVNVSASSGDFKDHDLDGEGLLQSASEHPMLSQVPTLLYLPDADSSPLVFFESGVANEETSRAEYDFVDISVASPADTRAAIDRLYHQSLKTPGGMYGSTKLWRDGAKYRPVPNTEKAIQALVRAAFIGAFPGLHATEEEMTDAGRFDIALVSVSENTKVYLGLLELKVLRKGEKAEESIAKGMHQAHAYAKEWSIPWAQLCCFDMRDVAPDDDPYVPFRAKASTLNVALDRWYLHSTHDRYREHVANSKINAS
ncbi:hypothetical protein [Clavibacter sp. CFBP 8614]|uniref:hypothetical protein n=1 Tax=unclassified Clavibacter TaxID=2626594 RepID=UPI00404127E6